MAPPDAPVNGHRFNNFFPWRLAGRTAPGRAAEPSRPTRAHEYFDRSFATDQPHGFISTVSGRTNPNDIGTCSRSPRTPPSPAVIRVSMLQSLPRMLPGQLARLVVAGPSVNPDDVVIEYLTPHRSTVRHHAGAAGSSGHYRNRSCSATAASWSLHQRAEQTSQPRYRHTAPSPKLPPEVDDDRQRWFPDRGSQSHLRHQQERQLVESGSDGQLRRRAGN